MNHPVRIAWLLGLVALAGCDPVPPLMDPPPLGITIRLQNGNADAASARARDYCARFGKRASRQSVTHDAGTILVVYSCT